MGYEVRTMNAAVAAVHPSILIFSEDQEERLSELLEIQTRSNRLEIGGVDAQVEAQLRELYREAAGLIPNISPADYEVWEKYLDEPWTLRKPSHYELIAGYLDDGDSLLKLLPIYARYFDDIVMRVRRREAAADLGTHLPGEKFDLALFGLCKSGALLLGRWVRRFGRVAANLDEMKQVIELDTEVAAAKEIEFPIPWGVAGGFVWLLLGYALGQHYTTGVIARIVHAADSPGLIAWWLILVCFFIAFSYVGEIFTHCWKPPRLRQNFMATNPRLADVI